MRIAIASAVVSVVIAVVPGMGVAEIVTWDGSGDMTWTDGDSNSWSGDTYDNGDDAQFLGAGLGTVTVSGAISPASVTVDAAGDYTFVSNAISGGGNLTKSGAGTLTLRSKQTYTGGTIVNGGVLELDGSDNTLASGSSLLIDGASSVVRLGPALFGNNVFGSGPLTIQNGGTLTDDTTAGAVHSVNGGLIFTNGGVLTSGGTGYNGSFGNYFITTDVNVTGSGAATISADAISLAFASVDFTVADVTGDTNADLTVSSVIQNWAGGGANPSYLNKDGPGTMVLTAQNTYTGGTIVTEGILELTGGGNRIDGAVTVDGVGTVKVSNNAHNNITTIDSITLQNGGTFTDNSQGGWVQSVHASVTFHNGGTMTSEPGTPGNSFYGNYLFVAGINVTGTGLATISANYIGFNFNQTITVADTVAGAGTDLLITSKLGNEDRHGTITKAGAGTLELTGVSNDIDPWAVNAGTLLVNSTLLGAVTVNSNATVGGVGTISGVVTNLSDGHIAPGTNSTGGTLTLAGGLTLNDGSILDIDVDTVGGTGDAIVISGGTFTGAASSGGVTVNVTTTGEEALFYDLIDWSGATGVGVDLSDFNVIYNGEDGNGRLSLAGNKLRLRAGALGMMMFVY